MTNNVVHFATDNSVLDIPVDNVLDGAKPEKLRHVVVFGIYDNEDVYLASSSADLTLLNLLLDICKAEVLDRARVPTG